MREYRIAELGKNRFRIEVKVVDEIKKGFLWWKKTEIKETWRPIDTNGYYLMHNRYFSNIDVKMPDFTTLEEAIEKINELNYICKYHYLNK